MCGIAGWIGRPPTDPDGLAHRLQEVLAHRGPDSAGFEHGPDWGLVFRRLSILDLSELGSQPMSSPCGRYWIVFNGEIYNYVELRAELEAAGERFVGGSDTEVLLRLLMTSGADCLSRLNGMFAFTFVDLDRRRFIMARDRLGQKPIYLYRTPDGLRFASELKGLLQWPDAPRKLDPTAVVQYLGLMYLPAERCILSQYEKLAPGHFMAGSLNNPNQATTSRYWSIDVNDEEGSGELPDEVVDELDSLLADATRIRLRSDVPVGVFLSGGIDSGLVVAKAAETGANNSLLALTVGFDDERYDETSLAQAAAAKVGVDSTVVPMEPSSLDQLDQVTWFYDEPFADPSALPTSALCRAARQHATVFLSGDGGDEAFGGYSRYLKAQRFARLAAAAKPVAPLLRAAAGFMPVLGGPRYRLTKLGLPNDGVAAAFDQIPNDPVLEFLLTPEYRSYAGEAGEPTWSRWANINADGSLIARQQQLDYELYLPDDILVKMDRASMASSIEVRSPFLDHRLVEWAARLPRACLTDGSSGKLPLRRLADRSLPPEVTQASKRGFGVPLDAWFRTPDGQQLVTDRLASADSPLHGIVDQDNVSRLLAAHTDEGSRSFGTWLWRLLVLDAWARNYLTS